MAGASPVGPIYRPAMAAPPGEISRDHWIYFVRALEFEWPWWFATVLPYPCACPGAQSLAMVQRSSEVAPPCGHGGRGRQRGRERQRGGEQRGRETSGASTTYPFCAGRSGWRHGRGGLPATRYSRRWRVVDDDIGDAVGPRVSVGEEERGGSGHARG